ncbi:hypothetical protein GCK32_001523, partial [Trichostrongylus colubriformis]
ENTEQGKVYGASAVRKKMTTSLSARQGLLTKTTGRLKNLLDEISETLRTRSSGDEEVKENGSCREEHDMQNRSLQLKKLKKAVETASTSVENALQTYTAAADMLDTSTPDLSAILDKVLSNSSVAQDLLLCAQTSMVELDMALEKLPMVTSASQEEETTPVQLAPIPVPKLSGKIWEWESFWSAFEYSVHTRRIGDIYKMNYLLDFLEGEARQSLKQFQISGSTYTMAINHLKKKYGNPQLLLDELVGQLENCRANSRRIEDQRILYEELSSILSQMSSKRECIDTALLQKQILSKFCSERWTASLLLSHVHDFINTEIEIQHNIEEPSQDQHMLRQDSMVRRITNTRNINERNHVCFFCRSSSHSPRDYTEYRTRQQRLDRMKRLSLCMNCGETNHMASTFTKDACRICHQRGHHTSICRQADPSTDEESTHFRKKVVTATQSHNPPPQRKTRQNFVSSTSNEDDDNNDDNVETVVCMKSTTTGATAKECVLVGEAQVFNAETQALETIHILLDTGADRSFIREDLARRLQLKNTDTLRMSINTFGSQQSKELVCGITNLQLFDCSGQPHWFRVARIPHITEKLQRSHLTLEDKHYLAENHIKLSVSQNSPESDVKLAVFADASKRAMAACAYVVATNTSHLVFARSKMARTVYNALAEQLKIISIVIFTDSEIVLNWLTTYPIKKDIGRFVTNRIMEIRKIINDVDCSILFGHVSTNENPADSATLTAKEMENHLWWEGPEFLKQLEQKYLLERQLTNLPNYRPHQEMMRLHTRKQAQEALASTLKVTEKFWNTWHKIYLRELREAHKTHMDRKRAGRKEPKEGMIVLIADANLPRNSWKLGRITALKPGKDGAIREVELYMPNGNTLRRPVKLLVPLELESEEREPPNSSMTENRQITKREHDLPYHMQVTIHVRFFVGMWHNVKRKCPTRKPTIISVSIENQVWELEWKTAFNIQLRIQDSLGFVIAWAGSHRATHRAFLRFCLDTLEVHPPACLEEPAGATHTIVDVNGESTVISSFNFLRGAVSTHQPLWRLTAELFTASSDIYCNSYCFLNLVISR